MEENKKGNKEGIGRNKGKRKMRELQKEGIFMERNEQWKKTRYKMKEGTKDGRKEGNKREGRNRRFHYVKSTSSNPLNFYTWNISWIMREVFSYNGARPKHEFNCNFESHCDLEHSPSQNNNTWRVTNAEELSRHKIMTGPTEDYSENSTRGNFLFFTSFGGQSPTVVSPWLRSNNPNCKVEMAVFLQRTGKYSLRLHPDNVVIYSMEAPRIQEKSR
ncbi:ALK tyrosine kinase receptor-like [Bufo bufo]|uniref:ALK tyrosine kinase receptor-like n=1 Tax=Bufo bufo TaxID=8384 RepID=UPI001ABE3646|nr:ALK tyrosine kinase receptor-like [Bufo bufo]